MGSSWKTVLLRREFYGRSSSAAPAEDRLSLDELMCYSLALYNLGATVENEIIQPTNMLEKPDAFIEFRGTDL